MAFGLTQWLISFVIFLVVLTIISWSAIHLGTKDKNATDIVSRFLDMDDYPIKRKNLTTRATESTDSTMLYANNQGFEITDSAEFYKILKAFRSTKNSIVNNTKDDTTTAIFTLSIINNSTSSKDTTIYNSSDTPFTLNNYQNISREIISM
ncbi:uncharacterized protein [Linepithema humile]|uniref:uncharacterized protein n=1 Tax=Linepithema humile TaxID=83485 RepID=UPI0006239822|nr:PREDICTED: uncharacterized protein LOC105680073 [Linepithema humile]